MLESALLLTICVWLLFSGSAHASRWLLQFLPSSHLPGQKRMLYKAPPKEASLSRSLMKLIRLDFIVQSAAAWAPRAAGRVISGVSCSGSRTPKLRALLPGRKASSGDGPATAACAQPSSDMPGNLSNTRLTCFNKPVHKHPRRSPLLLWIPPYGSLTAAGPSLASPHHSLSHESVNLNVNPPSGLHPGDLESHSFSSFHNQTQF